MKRTSRRTSGSRQPSRAPRRSKLASAPKRPTRRSVPQATVDAIAAFAKLAEQENLRWYVFGAQAVVIYGVPRVTGDIDITIDPGEKGLRGLLVPLRRAGFVPRISDPSFAIETRIYPVTHRATGWDIDLVLAGPGLEQRFLEEVHIVFARGHRIPVIAPEHLVSLKVFASRPKDLEDVRGMLRIADLDHARVERTLAELEAMLDQSDLRPVYARLRAEQASRKLSAKPTLRTSRRAASRRRGR